MTMETIPGTVLRETGDFKTPDFVKRYEANPILSPKDIPFPSTNTHNCGVIRHGDGFVMLFRSDLREGVGRPGIKSFTIGIADSDDGVHWKVREEPASLEDSLDPRVTEINGRYYITCAKGYGGATYVTEDFKTFEKMDSTLPGNRNQVIFPEKIGGYFYRLERPMWQPMMPLVNTGRIKEGWIGPTWDIWISQSPDLIHWGRSEVLLETLSLEYANAKIGAGAPPIRTNAGWLCLIHGDDIDPRRGKNGWEDQWFGRYHCGVMLLDLENPRRVIAYSKTPLITPETPYEREGGYRNDVIFVTSACVNEEDELMIYYGAADTHVCLARAKVNDVIDFCMKDRA